MQNVIGFHYTLKNKLGMLLDSTEGHPPMLFLTGSGQIIPGLEARMSDMAVGDKDNIKIAAKDAYGEVDESMRLTVKASQFPPEANVKVGAQFRVNEEPGAPIFRVVRIEGDDVQVDGNHPLAGNDLYFDIEITEKRAATKDELAHGHAHGPGGHHH